VDTQEEKQQQQQQRQQRRQQNSATHCDFSPGVFPAAALSPRQAFFADADTVPLAAAAGRVSAELLCPYPPGVPVIFPGERFTPASIQVLQDTLAGGGVVTGSHDHTLGTVLVVAGQE
jgi:arginine/lysine/ornithine decarboxylase